MFIPLRQKQNKTGKTRGILLQGSSSLLLMKAYVQVSGAPETLRLLKIGCKKVPQQRDSTRRRHMLTIEHRIFIS